MLRLLVNDIRLNAVFMFWVFVLFNLHLVLMAWLGGPGKYLLGGLQSGIAFASAMAVAVFLREEQSAGQIITRSLPISHQKVVYARYLLVATFLIVDVSYGLFYQRAVGSPRVIVHEHLDFLFLLNDSFSAIEHSLLARALGVTIAICIALPLIIRFGTFWRILIGYMVVVLGWQFCINSLVRWSELSASVVGSRVWVVLSVAIMVLMSIVSIRLSVQLYRRKEL